jgi:hypothetical protein
MKLTTELEESYAKELELGAYRSRQTVKEYVEESMRAEVDACMSFDEKDCPAQGTRQEKLTGSTRQSSAQDRKGKGGF